VLYHTLWVKCQPVGVAPLRRKAVESERRHGDYSRVCKPGCPSIFRKVWIAPVVAVQCQVKVLGNYCCVGKGATVISSCRVGGLGVAP